MTVWLTSQESRVLPAELEKLAAFMRLARKLGWNTNRPEINRRLKAMWWKYHER